MKFEKEMTYGFSCCTVHSCLSVLFILIYRAFNYVTSQLERLGKPHALGSFRNVAHSV